MGIFGKKSGASGPREYRPRQKDDEESQEHATPTDTFVEVDSEAYHIYDNHKLFSRSMMPTSLPTAADSTANSYSITRDLHTGTKEEGTVTKFVDLSWGNPASHLVPLKTLSCHEDLNERKEEYRRTATSGMSLLPDHDDDSYETVDVGAVLTKTTLENNTNDVGMHANDDGMAANCGGKDTTDDSKHSGKHSYDGGMMYETAAASLSNILDCSGVLHGPGSIYRIKEPSNEPPAIPVMPTCIPAADQSDVRTISSQKSSVLFESPSKWGSSSRLTGCRVSSHDRIPSVKTECQGNAPSEPPGSTFEINPEEEMVPTAITGNMNTSTKGGAFSSIIQRIAMTTPSVVRPCTVRNRVKDDGLLKIVHVDDDIYTVSTNGTNSDGDDDLSGNPFAKEQIEKWKIAAKEGTVFLQVLAILFALCAFVVTLFVFINGDVYFNITSAFCGFYTIVSSILILFLNFNCNPRSMDPGHFQFRIRYHIVKSNGGLKYLLGRGFLYFFAGTMSVALNHRITMGNGMALMGLGLLAMIVGRHSILKYDVLKESLTDNSVIRNKFTESDSDHDGRINRDEFANLILTLGLDMESSQMKQVFRTIDIGREEKINFMTFRRWWLNEDSYDGRFLQMDAVRGADVASDFRMISSSSRRERQHSP
jgi:hypothetical protein